MTGTHQNCTRPLKSLILLSAFTLFSTLMVSLFPALISPSHAADPSGSPLAVAASMVEETRVAREAYILLIEQKGPDNPETRAALDKYRFLAESLARLNPTSREIDLSEASPAANGSFGGPAAIESAEVFPTAAADQGLNSTRVVSPAASPSGLAPAIPGELKEAVKKVEDLMAKDRFDEAAVLCRIALEQVRNAGDSLVAAELGASLTWCLFKTGKTEEATATLAELQKDKFPALCAKVEESLAGTSMDPQFREILTGAKALRAKTEASAANFGRKPGILTFFNPFYQVARIKSHFSRKELRARAGKLMDKAWAGLARARETAVSNPSDQAGRALEKAESEFRAASILASELIGDPASETAGTPTDLFDPVELFAGLETSPYGDVEGVFNAIEPAVKSADGDSLAAVTLLNVNPEAWVARWRLLSSARRTIDTTYFIIDPDIFGKAFLGILLRKAREGVRVRLMMDARGVKALNRTFKGVDYVQELAALPNVDIKTFSPIHRNLHKVILGVDKLIASNHDKIIVIDDEVAVTGGRNIAKHYFAHPSEEDNIFRDTDVLLKGRDVAAQLRTAFEEEWVRARNTVIKADIFNFKERSTELRIADETMNRMVSSLPLDTIENSFPGQGGLVDQYLQMAEEHPTVSNYTDFVTFPSPDPLPVKILDKHSCHDERNDITANLLRFMDAARSEIIIENPYVVLSRSARAALVRASRRGVTIRIITNNPESSNDGYNDMALTQAMFLLDWKSLMRDAPNCRIHAMKGPNRLHAKVFVFDSKVAVIGTYNMDPMSEQINSEEVAAIRDETFAGSVRAAIMGDIDNSVEYTVTPGENDRVIEKEGPSKFFDPKVMKRLEFLSRAKLIRPLI